MRHKFSLLLTLFAWLLATGSQLDAVQTFAWIRMFAANSHSLAFAAAVERTFSPAGRCHLCVAVAKAKQQQEGTKSVPAPEKFSGKILLVSQPAPDVWVEASEVAAWPTGFVTKWSAGRDAPPLRPPRVLAA